MLPINLTKPELAFDAVRKSYKDLKPTDVALVSAALLQSGRSAIAIHDGQEFSWDKESFEPLTRSLLREVEQIQLALDAEKGKKTAKTVEEEPVTLSLHVKPSLAAAEALLKGRNDLKTLVSDILETGVEFQYSPTDIGWHWSLERVNWATLSSGDLNRRIRFRAVFEGNSEGIELGPGGKKRATKKK
ncbi:MAG: hypothetical protein IT207_08315 [Fimbriimonadaceae bacterium]|nr:hypothetical protein [Fimbriimonadaceae bacterium]